MIIGIVSGYFNPIHRGHIEYINAAKSKCDKLIAIVNNDKQVKLKGSIAFMDEYSRCYIVNNLKSVSEAIISIDDKKTVCKTIEQIFIGKRGDGIQFKFFNSGDRVQKNSESEEVKLCEKLGIEYVILPLPKICSSSELIKRSVLKYESVYNAHIMD